MKQYVSKENLEQYDAIIKSNIETRLKTYIGNAVETVNVTITSSVDGINPNNMKFNVFLNNGTIPTSYVTNAQGKASFQIERGSTYKIVFNTYGNAQPINPVQHTALFNSRDINVEYIAIPTSIEQSEKVDIQVAKLVDGNYVNQADVTVVCTINEQSVEYTTNNEGIVTFYVPYGQSYTVTVNNFDDYYVLANNNYRQYTACMAYRYISFKLAPFKTGAVLIDRQGNKYTLNEWKLSNKTKEEAVAIGFGSLYTDGKISFCIRLNDLVNLNNTNVLPRKEWATQQVLFNSIPTQGDVSTSKYYYDGQTATHLIIQEAAEKEVNVPIFQWAVTQTLEINDQILNGFVPSIGQEKIHVYFKDQTKDILEYLYDNSTAETYIKNLSNSRWVAAQNNNISAYLYTNVLSSSNKNSLYISIPFFAL